MTNTVSTQPAATPTGEAGHLITCTCSTHPEGMNSAIVRDHGRPFPKANIHGTVLMAHEPSRVIRVGAERRGIWAA